MSAKVLPFVKHDDRTDQFLRTQNSCEWLGYVRDGGGVKRCHTFPIIGEQTVAAHSWGVAQIIRRLWPECSKTLLLAALDHDVAERWTGDVPADAKWRNPNLRAELAKVETQVEHELGLNQGWLLSETEQHMLKWADRLELLQFCVDQRRLGNRNVDVVFARVIDYLGTQPTFPGWGYACELRNDINNQFQRILEA